MKILFKFNAYIYMEYDVTYLVCVFRQTGRKKIMIKNDFLRIFEISKYESA